MSHGIHLSTWVPRDVRDRFAAVARHQGMTESALLRRLVDLMLRSTDPAAVAAGLGQDERPARSVRLTVRLRPDDAPLLHARATARGIAPATYLSVLDRAHLRSLTPIPRNELLTLKRSVAELGAVGRNLNQIAHIATRTEQATGPSREDLRAFLRVCEGLRDHIKGLISVNLKSWERGYGE